MAKCKALTGSAVKGLICITNWQPQNIRNIIHTRYNMQQTNSVNYNQF